MLPEMPRHILQFAPQAAELLKPAVVGIEPCFAEVASEGLVRIDELELAHEPRQPIDLAAADAERLAELTGRAAAAIRDDIGRHRGTQLAVVLVDVLDDAFSLIAARQIEFFFF